MDNSVIVLDSSDDEAKEPNAAKMIKKSQRKTNSSAKCVVGDRVLVSNKHISIEKSKQKLPSDNLSMPLVNKTAIKITKPSLCLQSSLTLTPLQKNNVISNTRDKLVQAQHTDGKEFRRKIDTGELTIVPIKNAVPLNRASISPKNNNNTSSSIEISSILVPKPAQIHMPTAVPSGSPPSRATLKRITPTTISKTPSIRGHSVDQSNDSDALSKDSFATNDDEAHCSSENGDSNEPARKRTKIEKTPLNEAFTQLLDACRQAEKTEDMEKLINRKLIRYYECVHPDFVNSRSFRKHALAVAADIRAEPQLVYLKINSILQELNIRRKSGESVATNDATPSTGDARKDYQIGKLNKALNLLKKKIAELDEAEVNWDDEHNSIFMITERHKKRAWQIFEKICDITGESKNAQRLVKKPIRFKGSKYPEFNRTLQTFVNDTQMFPDMFDVLRCLEHCNLQYNYRLSKDMCKNIAQDAFLQIGEALQKRRKTDLYETASYFTGTQKDPALEDMELQTKLNQNQKYHDRIKELIDKFSTQQDPCHSDAAAVAPNSLDVNITKEENNFELIDLDASPAIPNNDANGSCPSNSDRTTTFDGCHNNINNNAQKYDGGPILEIVSVTSLQPDDPLLENKDESKIIISDDEEL